MKNTKVIVGILVILIAIALVITGSSDKNNEKIKIGVILPLTGPAASLTEDLQKSLSMFEETAENIELILQDDQCSGKGAISAYNVLKNQGIRIYIGACSGSILALAPILVEDGNVMLTGFGGSIEIRKTGDEVIRFIPDGLSIAKEMVKMIKQEPEKKYALFHEQQDYPQSVADFMESEIGDQIVIHEVYTSSDISFKTQILKIKESGVDEVIFIPVAEDSAQIIYKEMADLGLDIKIFGDVNVCDQAVQPSNFGFSGKCLKTVLQTEGYGKYMSDFFEHFNKEPIYPFYNAITYDIANILDQELKGVDVVGDKTITKLKANILDGVGGKITSYEFHSNGDVVTKSEYLKLVEFAPSPEAMDGR